ncbi:hypothetical protein INT45_001418 [Circinella minor]|uniref:L domain-like protein n=1 Tax=Circinella minor TaxID=1195481 RepID=A0A8H7RTI5_9FUNG|nr:hypothetical protein INT45_001418 [Circinella minor]
MSSQTALHNLQIPSHEPIHHLFSPTTLAHDLSYVDNTYYESTDSDSRSSSHSPTDGSYSKMTEKSQQSITRMHTVTFNRAINVLSSISRLDLRAVGLYVIPPQLTTLTRLTLLDLSYNRLESLPSSIGHLKHLRQLNLAHNRLAEIPRVIPTLKKLTYLDLSYNMFTEVPLSLSMLKHLTHLDLSYSHIDAVPAELLRLSIATIKTEGCPQLQEKVAEFTHSLAHNPPSLAEICARQMAVSHNIINDNGDNRSSNKKKKTNKKQRSSSSSSKKRSIFDQEKQQEQPEDLPDHLQNYIDQSKACFYCGEPYFDNPVMRYRIVQQHDGSCIPIRYNLCSAHWSDDQDRILALFSRHSS